MAKDPLVEQYPDIISLDMNRFSQTLNRIMLDVEHLVRTARQDYFADKHAKEKYLEWAKDSRECLRNEEKKSPNEAQNVSTSSEKRTSMIPLQVPPQHRNVTLRVIENPLTGSLSLMYSWDSENGKRNTRFIGGRDSVKEDAKQDCKVPFHTIHRFDTGDTY